MKLDELKKNKPTIKSVTEDIYLYIAMVTDALFWVGILLIAFPLLWDVLMIGVRGAYNWTVDWKGISVAFAGLLMVVVAWRVNRQMRG